MKDTHLFDVLVVYSKEIAASASSTNTDIIAPFFAESSNANYNNAYAHLLSVCDQYNLKAAFTTTSEIIDAGTCKSYWLYEKNEWVKVNNKCFAPLIFDKFAPINQERIDDRSLLFSSYTVLPFNDAYLLELFKDKYKTYKALTHFSIPTVTVSQSNVIDIKKALTKLKKLVSIHHNSEDFSSGIVLKDRNGAGGNHIYKLTSSYITKIQAILQKNESMKFVIQPFVKFESGFSYKNKNELTDVRLIFIKDKLVQAYIRIAKENEFRCNEHKGGTLEYISIQDIPDVIMQTSKKVLKNLTSKSSLYALDFIVSNNGNAFLLEGNTGPGLDWNLSKKINEKNAHHLIQLIVEEFVYKTEQSKSEVITQRDLQSKMTLPFITYPKVESI
ncbi:MAG TPA: sugar-transfer associated ATP-grasp domain-containing protein [Candidatus Levybacteria bacterium]|nr:sugar-transfer associated ATP-grasp domain-containing protein [Candidatus Levybacteria bacterium]